MKKCSRCSTLLKWNRSYCPLCGGFTVDAPEAEARPIAPEKSAAPAPEPVVDAAAAVEHVSEPEPAREKDTLPPRPVSSVPGLEYLDEDEHEAAAPAASKEKLTISDDLIGSSGASVGGFERFDEPTKLDLSAPIEQSEGMFEKKQEAQTIPTPQAPAPDGEFLRMFPDAKPD